MPLLNSNYEYDSETESSDFETEIISIDSLNNDFTKLDKPLKIISFLGNARIGKSTLLNCYVSNKINRNTKIFNTSKSLEQHCTSGIDMLCLEMSDYYLILLDVQGLDLNDSKDDCKLMLFIYMISNLIIFNPKTILDNTVLSSLQSLTSIITYIPDIESKTTKPSLLFRPRDIDQESDITQGKI
jgi:GTPase Era involved in 16S rRNA processing